MNYRKINFTIYKKLDRMLYCDLRRMNLNEKMHINVCV